MPERRRLAFDAIDAIMPDLDRLLAGHATVGHWSLGAICDHLARSIALTLDLPPADAPPTREQAVLRRLFFRAPAFPEGQSIPLAEQHPAADTDPAEAAEALRVALARLAAREAPFAPHPVLGPMTHDEWLRFHARHAAHHLSFAVPI